MVESIKTNSEVVTDGAGLPVEMFVRVPGLIPKGRFEGKEIIMDVDLTDKKTVKALTDAFEGIPDRLHAALFTGERKGVVNWHLGGATLLIIGVGLGYWELKKRKGEDLMHFGEKLREAKTAIFDRKPT